MIVTVPVYLSNSTADIKVEIQIRTIAMDFWASLEHKIYYKFEGNAPEHIRRELKECSELVSYLDQKMLSINEEVQQYSAQQSLENIVDGEQIKDETNKDKKSKNKSKKGRMLLGFGAY